MLTECRLTRQSLISLIREVRSRSAAFVVREMMAIVDDGHPAVLPLMEALQMDQSIVANALKLNARGQRSEKRVHRAKIKPPKSTQRLVHK